MRITAKNSYKLERILQYILLKILLKFLFYFTNGKYNCIFSYFAQEKAQNTLF